MSDDCGQNLESSNAFFQGRVIAKLESIEGMQHAQQAALSLKADSTALQQHIDSDNKMYDKLTDMYERLSQSLDDLNQRVWWIMGIVGAVALIGEALINHFWHG